jgi:hypothetical protein
LEQEAAQAPALEQGLVTETEMDSGLVLAPALVLALEPVLAVGLSSTDFANRY